MAADPKSTDVGAHVSRERPLDAAAALDADCVQIFLSDPGSYKRPPPHPEADRLRAAKLAIYVHAPYLVNVCSPRAPDAGCARSSCSRRRSPC